MKFTAGIATGLALGVAATLLLGGNAEGKGNPQPSPSASKSYLTAYVGRSPGTLRKPGDAIRAMQRAGCSLSRQLATGKRTEASLTLIVAEHSSDAPRDRATTAAKGCSPESVYEVRVTLRVTRSGNVSVTDKLTFRQAMKRVRALPVGPYRARMTFRGHERSVPDLIRHFATKYGLDVNKALAVAECESGLSPTAHNSCCHGVYSQHEDYWAGRAAHYGYPGASYYHPVANIDVSLQMVRDIGSWHPHWSQCA